MSKIMTMSTILHRRVSNKDDFRHLIGDEQINMVRRKLEYDFAREEVDEDTSFWTNVWKSICSLMLTCILMGPFLYTSYNRYHERLQAPSMKISSALKFFENADLLTCAIDLNISYSQIYKDASLSQDATFCRETSKGKCACENPTIASPRKMGNIDKEALWMKTFKRNLDLASSASDQIDVVFMGDSITEQWYGTCFADPISNSDKMIELWDNLFQDRALALGIAGDRCPNLLYRIQNGEMPEELNPSLWWFLIGTNDYNSDTCSRESILVGQLAILFDAMQRKPDANFVLQGLLPRGKHNLLESSLWKDFQWINDRLACISELPKLDFFNATSIFLDSDQRMVNQTLMSDFLHPSIEGHKLWGQAILGKIEEMGILKTNKWSRVPKH
jgi:lysophospholipase L1-like esterase